LIYFNVAAKETVIKTSMQPLPHHFFFIHNQNFPTLTDEFSKIFFSLPPEKSNRNKRKFTRKRLQRSKINLALELLSMLADTRAEAHWIPSCNKNTL